MQAQLTSSFRDPAGFLFRHEGVLYRQVNSLYREDYDHLITSGLYRKLIDKGLLIPHEEASLDLARSDQAYKILRPQEISLISYPYEWSFSQLKAAALATLNVQKIAFEHGMTLKDSSAYNIQFLDGKPILIDSLSLERYQEGAVWVPYRQFCQHFLAPLALMTYTDVRLSGLLRVFIDGVPLDLTARLLPFRARFRLSLLLHIFVHANTQRRYQDKTLDEKTQARKTTRQAFLGLLDNLESGVKKLDWKPEGTAWADYYNDDSYNTTAFAHKKQLVAEMIDTAAPESVWDLGANTGVFSRIASEKGIYTAAWDIDPGAVEINYRELVQKREKNLLPLLLDLTNPSGAIGWAEAERMSFSERAPVGMVMALALIHHLAIANNVPLVSVAEFLANLCEWLLIEFVPKSDKKVQTLLATRVDIFPDYTSEGFETAFQGYFRIERREPIKESQRILYLMRKTTP